MHCVNIEIPLVKSIKHKSFHTVFIIFVYMIYFYIDAVFRLCSTWLQNLLMDRWKCTSYFLLLQYNV